MALIGGALAAGTNLSAKEGENKSGYVHPWPTDIKKTEKTGVKTLFISSHPYPESSSLTKGLEAAARSVEGVEVRNLERLYGFDTRAIDAGEERRIMLQSDRVVFLFPTH